jgi:hypothetical protein
VRVERTYYKGLGESRSGLAGSHSPAQCAFWPKGKSIFETDDQKVRLWRPLLCARKMSDFSPTSVQLKSEINGECSCKRHQRQHLEFSTTLFGTRRTVVQIHSPRPTLLELRTYNTRKSGRPPYAVLGSHSRRRNPKEIWTKQQFATHRFNWKGVGKSIRQFR